MRKKDKPAIFHLILNREFFATIVAGTKKHEYRDYTPYWKRRLEGRHYDLIQFRNGHATNAPVMLVEFRGLRKQGRSKAAQYVVNLGNILKIKRCKQRSN